MLIEKDPEVLSSVLPSGELRILSSQHFAYPAEIGKESRSFFTISGVTSSTRSTSSSRLYREKEKRTAPSAAVWGMFIALRTWLRTREPEVQAEPEEQAMPW